MHIVSTTAILPPTAKEIMALAVASGPQRLARGWELAQRMEAWTRDTTQRLRALETLTAPLARGEG